MYSFKSEVLSAETQNVQVALFTKHNVKAKLSNRSKKEQDNLSIR